MPEKSRRERREQENQARKAAQKQGISFKNETTLMYEAKKAYRAAFEAPWITKPYFVSPNPVEAIKRAGDIPGIDIIADPYEPPIIFDPLTSAIISRITERADPKIVQVTITDDSIVIGLDEKDAPGVVFNIQFATVVGMDPQDVLLKSQAGRYTSPAMRHRETVTREVIEELTQTASRLIQRSSANLIIESKQRLLETMV